MSEQIAEAQLAAEEGERPICPECGKSFKNSATLASHLIRQHGVGGPRRERSSSGSKGSELNRLRRELKKDVNALCLLPFMAKGTAENLLNPDVTAIIEDKSQGFADAWVAVAEQNDFVRQNLTRALSGGIWLHAAAQTAALGYVVAVFSGFAPLHPGAVMLLPEMNQFAYRPAPEHAAAANGQPAEGAAAGGAEVA